MEDRLVLQVLDSKGLTHLKTLMVKMYIKNKDDPDSKSKSIKTRKSITKSWNEQFVVEISGPNQQVLVKLVDEDNATLGRGKIMVKELGVLDDEHDVWVDFKEIEDGAVHLLVRYVEKDLVEEELAFIKTKFFKTLMVGIETQIERDYIVILDKSGSMSGGKWSEAQRALEKLAPFVCKADPDGITFYVFSSDYQKYTNITKAQNVTKIFSKVHPSGGTALHKVLDAAFEEHFGTNKPTTILVITDGSPDSKEKVIKVIETASNKIDRDEDLSVTFIQIGDDNGATQFLKKLDDDLEGKFDIVDTVTVQEMNGMSFDEMIYKSIYD